MNETEADRQYYAAAEAAFIRRRGTPFLLSARDFALVKEWRALGVPIEAVEGGIDDAFSRREERGATGRVNSLSYCRDAVLLAWERRAQTAVGRGAAGTAEPDAAAALESLAGKLADVLRRRPDLSAPLDSALRSVGRLKGSGRTAGEIEASLVRLDGRLARALEQAVTDAERQRLTARAEELLLQARVR
ncbi:MAG TPA: hypothetical protein VLO07_10350, partial [Thermoanaerobaculia bacterium]|nr:hypothetical protein [Thermoanaerobaculia bacterium]